MHRFLRYAAYTLIAGTFFVPLLVMPKEFIFPFIVPKILVFRSLVLLLLGTYILLLLGAMQQYKLKFSVLHGLVGLYLISLCISTFVGVDWYKSFWDNHERMMGLFTLVHYILYYFIVSSIIKDWQTWRNFFRLFLFAGSIVMFIGVLQKMSPNLLLNQGNARVASTLGNAIYVGGYGLFVFFLGGLLFLREQNLLWRIYAAIGGLLGFTGLLLSGTRGSLVGLLVGLGVMLVFYAFSFPNHKKIQQSCRIVLLLGVLAGGLLFSFRQTDFVRDIPAVGRLLNTSITEGTANTRIMAWGLAVDAFQERPVFGWGPNNYYYAFNQYYKPEFLEKGYRETWFDNAHNVVMNTLAIQGLFGIVVFIALYVTAVLLLWKRYREGSLNIHVASVSIAFLFAHFTHNFFVFENPTSYLYFFFFLAFIGQQSAVHQEEKKEIVFQSASVPLVILVSFFVLFFIFTTNIRPAQANMKTLESMRLVNYDIDLSTQVFQEALASNTPHIDDIRADFVRIRKNLLKRYIQEGNESKALSLFQLMDSYIADNLALHPLDIRMWMQRGELHQLLGMASGQKNFFEQSYAFFDEARKLSPQRQQVLYLMGLIGMQMNEEERSLQWYQQALDDNPNIVESWWRLALAYNHFGKETEAKALVAEAQMQDVQFNKQATNALQQVGLLEPVE